MTSRWPEQLLRHIAPGGYFRTMARAPILTQDRPKCRMDGRLAQGFCCNARLPQCAFSQSGGLQRARCRTHARCQKSAYLAEEYNVGKCILSCRALERRALRQGVRDTLSGATDNDGGEQDQWLFEALPRRTTEAVSSLVPRGSKDPGSLGGNLRTASHIH